MNSDVSALDNQLTSSAKAISSPLVGMGVGRETQGGSGSLLIDWVLLNSVDMVSFLQLKSYYLYIFAFFCGRRAQLKI